MIYTPKKVAKNRFNAFKNSISKINPTELPLTENEFNNLVILSMINFKPFGKKAKAFYDKLCNDYLDRNDLNIIN